MRVLVCTTISQGKRKSDFCFTEEGELAYFGMVCDGNETIDGGCGCQRSFCGMVSHKATTTARVVERPITRNELIVAFSASMKDAGWNLDDKYIEDEVDELIRIANTFPEDKIIEKRGTRIQYRKP